MTIGHQSKLFNRDSQKQKKNRFSHTANTPYGMGDHYGTGIKAKIGRMREGTGMATLSKKQLGTPPKSLA